MKEKLLKYGVQATLALGALSPAFAAAQNLPPPPFTDPSGAIVVLCRIAGWMFTFLIVLAIIFVLLAAFNYLTAGGDAEKVKGATNMLIYAAVAVAVALFARGFPLLVTNLIATASVQGC